MYKTYGSEDFKNVRKNANKKIKDRIVMKHKKLISIERCELAAKTYSCVL